MDPSYQKITKKPLFFTHLFLNKGTVATFAPVLNISLVMGALHVCRPILHTLPILLLLNDQPKTTERLNINITKSFKNKPSFLVREPLLKKLAFPRNLTIQ